MAQVSIPAVRPFCLVVVLSALASCPPAHGLEPMSASSLAELQSQFADPGRQYRIQFLLRTNDAVDPAEIAWQIREMKDKGCGGAFSYSEVMQNGAPCKFLSDEWWKVVDATAKACAEAGLLYWAYDEQDWPSGSVGGQLLEKHPEFRWKYLHPTEHRTAAGVESDIDLGRDVFVAAVAFRGEGKSIVPDSLTDLGDRVRDGRLRWTPPGSGWTVAVYTAVVGPWGWSNLPYPDLMDRQACATFVDWVYRGHDERVRKIPGASLFGFFTDEPSLTTATYPGGAPFTWYPSMPWTPGLPAAFKADHGYDLGSHLPLLYRDGGSDSLKMRCHFWETCARLYAENYFGQIYDYCDRHGMKASGHIHVEESLLAHLTLQGGNVLDIYRKMHVPGIDWIYPFGNALPATTPKYATSAAHLLGRERTWCESFAACGWGLTFQEIRDMVNWEHVNGINMVVPICYKYSLRGPDRLKFYNPGISYQQPYWDHFRGFADYDARMCLLTAGLGHVAQVGLFYPSADLWSHCWDHDLLAARTGIYNDMADRIRAGGYDFDILDDRAVLHELRLDGPRLRGRHEAYEMLIVPPMDTVRRETLARLAAFAKAGGRLVFLGSLPQHSIESGADDPEVRRIVQGLLGEACYGEPALKAPHRHGSAGFAPTPVDAIRLCWELLAPDVVTSPRPYDVFAYHRQLPDGHLYLLFNRKNETRTFEISLSAAGKPERWDAMTGRVVPIEHAPLQPGRTQVHYTFAPREMIAVVLRPAPGGAAGGYAAAPPKVIEEIPVSGPFRFRTEQTLARAHVAWNFSQAKDGWLPATQPAIPDRLPAGDWSKLGLPGFSGLGHYETEIRVDRLSPGTRAILDLGAVAVSAEVFVNGRSAGLVFFAPYRLDITGLLRPGANTLHVVVANTLVNYYSQFKELATARLETGGIREEHRVSGLLGPVVVRIEQP
jgi:hypothetical protein